MYTYKKKKISVLISIYLLGILSPSFAQEGDVLFSNYPSQETIDNINRGNNPQPSQDSNSQNINPNNVHLLQQLHANEVNDNVLFVQEETPDTQQVNHHINEVSKAIQTGNVEALINLNWNSINDEVYDGNTIIHIAALHNDIPLLKFALEKKANLKKINKNGESFLNIGASTADINFFNTVKNNVSEKEWQELIQFNNKNKQNVLHSIFLQSKINDKNLISYLIKEGDFINIKDKDGYTPLSYAIGIQDWEVVAILLDNGGNLQLKPNEGNENYEQILLKKFPIIKTPMIITKLSPSAQRYLVSVIDNITINSSNKFKDFEEFIEIDNKKTS